MRIDFFGIGVQKGGTTVLYHYLSQHPGIQMASKKEIHHFDNEDIDWQVTNHDELHNFFDWSVDNVIRGEITPSYIYWPFALQRLYKYNPYSKLILLLRHPTYRAYSQWRMNMAKNKETLTFEKCISTIGRQRVKQAHFGAHRVYSYIERCFYAKQIHHLLNIFPRENILFIRTDALYINHTITLTAVENFLDIDNVVSKSAKQKYTSSSLKFDFDNIPHSMRKKLNNIFYSDILETSKLTQLDLSDWCQPDYCEPMERDRAEYLAQNPTAVKAACFPAPSASETSTRRKPDQAHTDWLRHAVPVPHVWNNAI